MHMRQYEKIKKIEAHIGGYFGGYYQVEVDLEHNLVAGLLAAKANLRRNSS